MFIATYYSYSGFGETLEEALEDLKNINRYDPSDRDCINFYEATKIDVEFTIVIKEKPVKVTTTKRTI